MTNEYSYTIFPEDLDGGGLATIPSLYRTLINSVGLNIRREGFGIDVMEQKGLSWVLARCAVEIKSRPRLYDKISIQVWGGCTKGLCHERCVKILSEDGGLLGNGITEWCVIDKASRKPVTMEIAEECSGELPCLNPRRLKSFLPQNLIERITGYCECDFNGHLNNSKYVEMFFDQLPLGHASSQKPLRLDVNFKKEIPCGVKTTSGVCENENGGYDFCMFSGNEVACCASLNF